MNFERGLGLVLRILMFIFVGLLFCRNVRRKIKAIFRYVYRCDLVCDVYIIFSSDFMWFLKKGRVVVKLVGYVVRFRIVF